MKNKIILLAITLTLIANLSQSQELISIKNSKRFYPGCIRSHNDTIYLGGSLLVSYPEMSGTLFRYTIEGERIDSIYFDRPESTIIFSIMFRGDSTYVIASKQNTVTGQYDLELIILNHQLMVLKDTIIAQNFGNSVWRCYSMAENANEYLIYGCYWLNYPATAMGAFIFKINYRGEVLKEKRYSSNLGYFIYSLLKRNDNLYYAIGNTSEFFDSTNQVSTIAMVLDSNFDVKKVKTTPHFLSTFQSAFWVGNSIFGSGTCVYPNNTKMTYGFLKTDTNFRKKDSIYFGLTNVYNAPGAFESDVYVDVDKVYVAGTKNFYYGLGNPDLESQILVSRLDTGLNVIWNKQFTKDSIYYQLWSMTSTSDGGCLLACETYNYLSPVVKRGIVVFRVDTSGNAYAVIGEMPQEVEFLLYPNPATDKITIESSSIQKNATISIYNIQGQLLLRQVWQQTKHYIDISSFSKGVYFVNIKSEKENFSWRFVKE
jgi:hypothetical protein